MTLHLGVIGGMGTEAGLKFCQIICEKFRDTSQQFPKISLISDETIPDRSAYLLGKSDENPARKISQIGKDLITLGVDKIVIACFTAHSPQIFDQVNKDVKAKILPLFTNLGDELKNYQKVGILSTTGTRQAKVFESNFPTVEFVYPNYHDQALLMESIYEIKKVGVTFRSAQIVNDIASRLENMGEIIILGCTELLLIDFFSTPKIINPISELNSYLLQSSKISFK